jgi:hypothetical protein
VDLPDTTGSGCSTTENQSNSKRGQNKQSDKKWVLYGWASSLSSITKGVSRQVSAKSLVRREARVLNSLTAITDSVSVHPDVCRVIQRLFAKTKVSSEFYDVSLSR